MGVPRRTDEHEAILAQRDHGDARASVRVGDDAEIDAALERVLVDLVRATVLEVELHLRVRLQEALQLRGELVEPDGVHRRDAYRAGHDLRRRLQPRLEFLVALHDLLAHLVEDLAGGRELHVAARALEELLAVLVLQHADLLRNRGLGDVVLRRGDREALGLDDVAEHFEGLEMHANTRRHSA